MWRTEWDALSARIAAFLEAAQFLLSTGTARQEFYGANELAENGKRIVEGAHRFHADHGRNIPEATGRTPASLPLILLVATLDTGLNTTI